MSKNQYDTSCSVIRIFSIADNGGLGTSSGGFLLILIDIVKYIHFFKRTQFNLAIEFESRHIYMYTNKYLIVLRLLLLSYAIGMTVYILFR